MDIIQQMTADWLAAPLPLLVGVFLVLLLLSILLFYSEGIVVLAWGTRVANSSLIMRYWRTFVAGD